MKNTCKVLFYIKRSALLRDGTAAIMGRVTVNGRRCQFSTRLAIPPSAWDVDQNRVVGRSLEYVRINRELDGIRLGLEKSYRELITSRGVATASEVRDHFMCTHMRREGLIALFRRHNEQFSRQVGVTRSRSTLYKYQSVLHHLEHFLAHRYQRSEIQLYEVNRPFVVEFHAYLLRESGRRKNTAWVYLTALKHLLSHAHRQGALAHNPFADYRLRNEHVHRTCLTEPEIRRFMELTPCTPSLTLVRDAFLFSCFTGLSFVDLKQLTRRQITRFGDHRWIETTRRKTGSQVQVRLLDVAHAILQKYTPEGLDEVIFPLPSNSWCNRCLARLMQAAQIHKSVTFHCARHTFATTVTLSNGMPIETISKLLGHTSIRTTQIYATVTRAHLDREMNRLSEQLNRLSMPWQA